MADQRLSAGSATANRVETVPSRSWRRKRSLHSRMIAARAGKERNSAQATGVNQASSEDTASQQQPLEQLASEPEQPELSHTPPAFPHQRQAHTDIPATETNDLQPGPSTQSTSEQRNNDDELLLSHGQQSESTSDDEVHQLYTLTHAFLTYMHKT